MHQPTGPTIAVKPNSAKSIVALRRRQSTAGRTLVEITRHHVEPAKR